jgi:SNF2 family DNA or RNA helicase
MRSIVIQLDATGDNFLLSGDITELRANRRARFFMKDYLKAEMSPDPIIRIPFQKGSESNREKVLEEIRQLLERSGFEGTFTVEAQAILSNHLREQENFKIFTEKARRVWNNDLDSVEFERFVSVIRDLLVGRTLYDLQLLSAFHLAFAQNACNFSVPGSGKTSVVYAAYAFLNSLPFDHPKYVNKLLIIGPLSSFGPWEDEYFECFNENPDIKRLSAGVPKDERVRHLLSPNSAEITIITYQGIRNNLSDLVAYLRRHENKVMVVLDEAHRIKNTEGGIWAQSVLALAKYCKSRVILTGTPAPNGYEDIYNLYNFIWPDKNIIGFHLYHLKEMSNNPNDSRINTLIDNVHPFFIRITKMDLIKHMDLPKASEHPPIAVEMGPVQRQIYDLIELSYVDYFQKAGRSNSFLNALVKARLIRLQQCVTNPALLRRPLEEFYGNEDEERISNEEEDSIPNDLFIDDSDLIDIISQYKELESPSKFTVVKEMVEKLIEEGKKVVIWGIFIQTIKSLQEYLAMAGIASKLLIGEIPTGSNMENASIETREMIIREFNSENSSFMVLIANPASVAESISLHKACHNAIYLERNFNAANYIQSKDRIHRVGGDRKDNVNYYFLVSKNSIDETIHERLKEKESNMLRIIESKPIPIINLNMGDELKEEDKGTDTEYNKDIKALIKDYVSRSIKAR